MTANQRNRALILLVAAILCLSLESNLILTQGPGTLAAAAGFASFALAIYGAGYAAVARGHSRLWAFLGLVNFFGILIVFCFKDLVHVSPSIDRQMETQREGKIPPALYKISMRLSTEIAGLLFKKANLTLSPTADITLSRYIKESGIVA